jgi:hypothetical protein
MSVRISVIEPAYINTSFDANAMAPDVPLDAYREVRAAVDKRVREVLESADGPEVVAETLLRASLTVRPKLRYASGGLAGRLRLPSRFAPAGLVDAGIRKDLRLTT